MSEQRRIRKRTIVPWLIGILFWLIFISWLNWKPTPEAVEFYYSCGLYRAIVIIATLVQQTTHHSLALIFLPLSIFLFIVIWIGNWIYLRKKLHKTHSWGIFWLFKWSFILSGVIIVSYFLLWGVGYHRKPIEEKLKLELTQLSEEEIKQILDNLLPIIIENDIPYDDRNVDESVKSIAKSMQKIVSEWDEVPIYLPLRVKKTPPGLFLLNSTSGMCIPLTLEPHVDGALPPASFVATSAHELSHIAGYCGEAEASFVGYAAGFHAEDKFAKYSLALDLYENLAHRLPATERDRYLSMLPERAKEDLKREKEITEKYRITWLSNLSWKVYDKYLKSQGVKEGIKDYGRAVNLISAGIKKGLIPISKTNSNYPSINTEQVTPQNEGQGLEPLEIDEQNI
ncbi:MAG: DUF3810 domain-containing protein [Candidatus Hydrogenedentes bacterium]|nr:DUF3810 domain-containing protein [Candidatus Hydrogenedentota bacterium]